MKVEPAFLTRLIPFGENQYIPYVFFDCSHGQIVTNLASSHFQNSCYPRCSQPMCILHGKLLTSKRSGYHITPNHSVKHFTRKCNICVIKFCSKLIYFSLLFLKTFHKKGTEIFCSRKLKK